MGRGRDEGTGRFHLDLALFIFFNFQTYLIKKLNGMRRGRLTGMRKFSNPSRLYFFLFFYYIKINIFHKK